MLQFYNFFFLGICEFSPGIVFPKLYICCRQSLVVHFQNRYMPSDREDCSRHPPVVTRTTQSWPSQLLPSASARPSGPSSHQCLAVDRPTHTVNGPHSTADKGSISDDTIMIKPVGRILTKQTQSINTPYRCSKLDFVDV